MPTAGYSGTPLARKLGFKPGHTVFVDRAPKGYAALVAPLPEGIRFVSRLTGSVDLIHLFTDRRADLARRLPACLAHLAPGGTIWVSWPKKAARVPTDVTEDVIRAVCLPLGLVDVKVCAVDQTWSGLKLTRRRT